MKRLITLIAIALLGLATTTRGQTNNAEGQTYNADDVAALKNIFLSSPFFPWLLIDVWDDEKGAWHPDYSDPNNPIWQDDANWVPSIKGLSWENGRLIKIDWSHERPNFRENESFTIKGLGELTTLVFSNSPLYGLTISELPKLTLLSCNNTGLVTLEVSGLPELKTLNCNNNRLTDLDLSGLPELTLLNCRNNRLTGLDLSGLPKVESLNCSDNHFSFNTLAEISAKVGIGALYFYSPQSDTLTVKGGETIDMTTPGLYKEGQVAKYRVKGTTEAKDLQASFTFPADWAEGQAYTLELWRDDLTLFDPEVGNGKPFELVIKVTEGYANNADLAALTTILLEDTNPGLLDKVWDGGQGATKPDPADPADPRWHDTNGWAPAIKGLSWTDGPTGRNKRLEKIDWSDIGLTGNLIVKDLGELTTLTCSGNTLTGLTVTGLDRLTLLSCNNTAIDVLDLSGLTELETLNCNYSRLTDLNLSGLLKLKLLNCRNNRLTNLDLSSLTKVESLNCSGNHFSFNTLAEISAKVGNGDFYFYSPQSDTLTVKAGSAIDMTTPGLYKEGKVAKYRVKGITGSKDLEASFALPADWADGQTYTLELWRDDLTLFDPAVINGKPFELVIKVTEDYANTDDLAALMTLFLDDANTGLFDKVWDVKANPDLKPDPADPNDPRWVNSKGWAPAITGLTWTDGQTGQNKRLEEIDWSGADLTGVFTLKGLGELTALYCNRNGLTELNLSDLPRLTSLFCSGNKLTALTLSDMPELTALYCHNNRLAALTLSDLPELTTLYCDNNRLTALNLSNLPKLTTLNCSYNQLTNPTLSADANLYHLQCNNNHIPFNTLAGLGSSYFYFYAPQSLTLTVETGSVVNMTTVGLYKNGKVAKYRLKGATDVKDLGNSFALPADWTVGQEYTLELWRDDLPAFDPETGDQPFELVIKVIARDIPPVDPPEPTVYHAVTLTLGEGIRSNRQSGTFDIIHGGEFYLTFETEDLTLTADDIILHLDGVDTPFTEMPAGHFSYTLRNIDKGHTVTIALRELPVGNTEIGRQRIRIATRNGQLTIDNETAQTVNAYVYTVTGATVATRTVAAGATDRVTLPAGIYIVHTPEGAVKIVMKQR